MTVDLVPNTDLVPSLASRIVTVNATDAQEGTWAAGESVRFRIVGDVHVPTDRRIVLGHKGVTLPLPEGRGQVRLPVWTAATGEWAVEVKPSWTPHPYFIRVPAGSGSVDLSQINPLHPVDQAIAQWLLTNASVTATEGAAWGASVSVSGGTAHFDFTFPPGGTAWYRGQLAGGMDLDELDTAPESGVYQLSSSGGYVNVPAAQAGLPALLLVNASGFAGVQELHLFQSGVVYQRRMTNSTSRPRGWSEWIRVGWDKGNLPSGTNIDTLDRPNDSGMWRVPFRGSVSGTFPIGSGGTLTVMSPENTGAMATQLYTSTGLGEGIWFRAKAQNGTDWLPWVSLLTAPTPPAPVGANVGMRHQVQRGMFIRRRGGRIGTNGKAVVSLRFDDSTDAMTAHIMPLLREHAMPASLVLCSKTFETPDLVALNQDGDWPLVTQWALEEGIEVWHHGGNHKDASGTAALTREIVTSAADIRAALPELAIEGWVQPGVGGTNYDGAAAFSRPEHFMDHEAGRLILSEHAVAAGHHPGRSQPLTGELFNGGYAIGVDQAARLSWVQNTLIPVAQSIGGGVTVMLHPADLGKTETHTTPAQFAAFIAWLAGERDAGRVEIMTMSGQHLADASSDRRQSLVRRPDFSSSWTTAGWSISSGVASTTSTQPLQQGYAAEWHGWSRGAAYEVAVDVDGSGVLELRTTSTVGAPGWEAAREIEVNGPGVARLHAVIPNSVEEWVLQITRLSGGAVQVSNPRYHAI